MTSSKEQHVLIVGAGVFGLSTALHLLQRGWQNVTIFDRSPVLPAPDAASTDINKIVRSSYSDPTYTLLAREAIAAWKNVDDWGDTYNQCGILLRGGEDTYASLALNNDINHGANVKRLQSGTDVIPLFPNGVQLGPSLLSEFEGYVNFDGGWANARQGVEFATAMVRRLGARIEPNRRVCGLTADGFAVKLEDGTEARADLIIVATGSWTASAFPGLGVNQRVLATGQSIATIELTEEEGKVYADVPVVLDYTSGFYVIPPNASNIMKLAIHSAGYTHMQNDTGYAVSTPRTHLTHENGWAIPVEMVHSLRAGLTKVYPDLGQRPFASTRMCWFADHYPNYIQQLTGINGTDSDWLIDFHPDYPSVLFATGGSGHAYKFLPILGRLVADRLEGKLDSILATKFAFDRVFNPSYQADLTRSLAVTKELDISKLCSSEDLLPASHMPRRGD